MRAPGIHPLDVRAGHADVSGINGNPGGSFRGLHGFLHRQRRQVEIYDHAFAPSLGFRNAQARQLPASLPSLAGTPGRKF